MPPLIAVAASYSTLNQTVQEPSSYAEAEVYTNTMPYTGPIEIPPPFEGYFLCGLRISLVERSKVEKTTAVRATYLNQRLEEPIQWLAQRVEVGAPTWTPTMYPVPRDVIKGTKLAIELEGLKDAKNTIVMVKCLYMNLSDLVSKHGWAFVDDRGGLQQFALFNHESYWLSISQFHKLGATSFPISPVPAIPSMRRLLTGFDEELRMLEKPDSLLWAPVPRPPLPQV